MVEMGSFNESQLPTDVSPKNRLRVFHCVYRILFYADERWSE